MSRMPAEALKEKNRIPDTERRHRGARHGMLRKSLAVLLALLFIAGFSGRASAERSKSTAADLTAVLSPGTPECGVGAQKVKGRVWLLLPASADFERLTLDGPPNALLRGSVPDAVLSLDENGLGKDLNLTELFGEMKPGTPYVLSLQVPDGKGEKKSSLTLMKSAALSSLHIILDTPLKGINASADKSAGSGGFLVKLDPEGNPAAEGVLERLSGRGNASWTHSGDKKPYNLKLKEAAQLIDGAGVARSWCLLSNNVMADGHDRTGLYNQVALKMFQDLGGASALSSEPVDLYINREYRGTYLLTEKVEIQETRVDIRKSAYAAEDRQTATRVLREDLRADGELWRLQEIMEGGPGISLKREKASGGDELLGTGIQAYQYASGSELKPGGAGGYLLELDFRFYDARSWFITRRGAQVVVKEPEYAAYEQLREIALYVQQMEDALYADSGLNTSGRHYSEYIDLVSLADSYALDAFTANIDAFLTSAYFYTDRDEQGGLTPLVSGPAWDYDYAGPGGQALLSPRLGERDKYPEVWVLQFLTKGDFMQELQAVCRNRLRPLWQQLNEGGLEAEIARLTVSQKMNGLLWENDFESGAARYASALRKRFAVWYDSLWQEDKLTGLQIVPADGMLEALVTGTAETVRWYRVDEADGWTLHEIAGETGTRFLPAEDGVYIAAAEGQNAAWNPALKGKNEYLLQGEPQPVAREKITLYSAPFRFEAKA